MSSKKGGRGKDPLWIQFSEIENEKVKCKQCPAEISAKIERLRGHFKKCPGRSRSNQPQQSISQSSSSDASSSTMETAPPPKRPKHQQDIKSHVKITTAQDKEALANQWARFFYSARIPFNASENPEFIKAIDMTRPGIGSKLINRKSLAGKHLDREYAELEQELKVILLNFI